MIRAVICAIALSLVSASQVVASVDCVQAGLAKLGFPPGPIDGLMGPKTRAAATAFQATANLPLAPLSRATSATWCAALQAYSASDQALNATPLDLKSSPSLSLGEDQLASLWKAHERAETCGAHPQYGAQSAISVSVAPGQFYGFSEWRNPFAQATGNSACNLARPDFSLPPDPLRRLVIDPKDGTLHAPLNNARRWFSEAAAFARYSGDDTAELALKFTLLDWAENKALQSGIRPSGKRGPVDQQVLDVIVAILVATAEVASDLDSDERQILGPWLARMVAEAGKSTWPHRQDGRAQQAAYIALLWGVISGDRALVDQAVERFKLAIHDMRPDGSWVVDSQRAGSGISAQVRAAGYLVMADFLLNKIFDARLLDIKADDRSAHGMVDFVTAALDAPEQTNQQYARQCPGDGDAWGSIANPDRGYLRSGLIAYLPVYAGSYPTRPSAKRIDQSGGVAEGNSAFSAGLGGAPACLAAGTVHRLAGVLPVVPNVPEPESWPEPKFLISSFEERAAMTNDKATLSSWIRSTVSGAKAAQSLHFAVSTTVDPTTKRPATLSLIFNQPADAARPTKLDSCETGRLVEHDDGGFGIAFELTAQDDGNWTLPKLDCAANRLGKARGRELKFLTANFQDITIGLARGGQLDQIEHAAIRDLLRATAAGDIRISR